MLLLRLAASARTKSSAKLLQPAYEIILVFGHDLGMMETRKQKDARGELAGKAGNPCGVVPCVGYTAVIAVIDVALINPDPDLVLASLAHDMRAPILSYSCILLSHSLLKLPMSFWGVWVLRHPAGQPVVKTRFGGGGRAGCNCFVNHVPIHHLYV
jgi:hypothetical protein